jgi:hypothetical protein
MKKAINGLKEQTDMTIKVNLSVFERINFPSIMPSRGNTSAIELGLAIKRRIDFNAEEVKEYSIIKLPDGRTARNIEHDNKLREFRFEAYEILRIQEGARILEENEKVEERNLELVKKFMAIDVKRKAE